jgi:sulfur carrier protein ThiS adenylyltransferase
MLSDLDFEQFSRQIAFSDIGEVGQKRLFSLKVLIIGVGGLGCSVAQILVRSGVRHLVIMDSDTVSLSNLPRQVLFKKNDLGIAKVIMAKIALKEMSKSLHCRTVNRMASESILTCEVPLADIVVDCTDNRGSRLLINQVCLSQRIPLISGACIGWQGMQMQFAFHQQNTGCYACLFPTEIIKPTNCESDAITLPLVSLIAARQAFMVLRFGWGLTLPWQTLFHWQVQTDEHQSIKWSSDPQCAVCGQ